MSTEKICFFIILGILFSSAVSGQSVKQDNIKAKEKNYSDCAAILYNGKMLVDEYSPRGICKLEAGMEGKLTVATVMLNEEGGVPIQNLGFKVAIKNDRTNTIWMFSEDTRYEVELKEILKKCEKDDKIILITVDQKYSLTHHEIVVMPGS